MSSVHFVFLKCACWDESWVGSRFGRGFPSGIAEEFDRFTSSRTRVELLSFFHSFQRPARPRLSLIRLYLFDLTCRALAKAFRPDT